MIPTLGLGPPWDAPDLEIMHRDINPVIALLIEHHSPLNECDLQSVWSFLQLDGLCLDAKSEGFFLKVENICQRIVAGELLQYSVDRIKTSEFEDYIKRGVDDGIVNHGVRVAAHRFLEFLATNPGYWPLRAEPG